MLSFFFISNISFAQMVLDWVRVYDGSFGGVDVADAITVDDSGNVYVTGASQITSPGLECVTIKYNKWGETIWTSHFFRTGNFIGKDIKLDDSGNVYVAAGLILKYDNNGNLIWDSYDATAYNRIELDSAGNIYAGGTSLGKLTTGKYNKNGQRIWRNTYSFSGTAGSDYLGGFVKDLSGNLIITGASKSTVSNFDYATIKYSNNGQLIWSRRYNNGPTFTTSSDQSYGITNDLKGNIYVTGSSEENSVDNCVTIKYDSSGNTVWINRIPLSAHIANAGYNLATDSSQNVFIAARDNGRTTIIKLDSSANIIWYRIFPQGNFLTDNYPVIILDSIYNVYTTAIGRSTGEADYVAIKYDSSGNQIYTVIYDSGTISFDYVYDLALDKDGSIILTGEFSNKYGTVKYSPLKTSIPVNEVLPFTYSLSQNYPNPFNPSTKISYELLVTSYATLKVYDVLGNEVATLVNENKPAGSYEVEFDGSDCASGIYFYSLSIDGVLVDTKRMVLLR